VPPSKWFVQPQSPTNGNGYSQVYVGSGINAGAYYIGSVSVGADLAAAINPDYLPGGVEYITTQCDPYPRISFIEFNAVSGIVCGGGGSQWIVDWVDFVWDHEDLHMSNAVSYMTAGADRNVPAVLESVTGMSATSIQNVAQTLVAGIGDCVNQVAAGHLSHSGTPNSVSFWSSSQRQFNPFPSGTTWWSPNTPSRECNA